MVRGRGRVHFGGDRLQVWSVEDIVQSLERFGRIVGERPRLLKGDGAKAAARLSLRTACTSTNTQGMYSAGRAPGARSTAATAASENRRGALGLYTTAARPSHIHP